MNGLRVLVVVIIRRNGGQGGGISDREHKFCQAEPLVLNPLMCVGHLTDTEW